MFRGINGTARNRWFLVVGRPLSLVYGRFDVRWLEILRFLAFTYAVLSFMLLERKGRGT